MHIYIGVNDITFMSVTETVWHFESKERLDNIISRNKPFTVFFKS
jgi:hypothetical protein